MSGTVFVEISSGELIDKITILRIKLDRFTDPAKRRNVAHELAVLDLARQDGLPPVAGVAALEDALCRINLQIWDLEDVIRDLMRADDYGPAFVEATRTVHRANEERGRLKRQINDLTGSAIVEEKAYGSAAG